MFRRNCQQNVTTLWHRLITMLTAVLDLFQR